MSLVVTRCLTLLCVVGALSAPAWAQTLNPAFTSAYSIANLGTASNVPTNYGGLVMKNGDANSLLIGGSANNSGAAIYQVSAVRSMVNGRNRITGFTGTASQVSTATGNSSGGIDGGLLYAPNGTLLYTSFSDNTLGMIKPGSTTPDKRIDLTAAGVLSSVGAMQIIPAGFGANSGKLLIASYNSNDYYTADLVADGTGTYNLANLSSSQVNLPGGPEGIIYVPGGSPLFANPTMLVSEYGSGRVSAYSVNASGIPILSTRQDFITDLSGVEGATIDASTGDFLFSTFGGNSQVIAVRGFATVVPEVSTGWLMALPLLGTLAGVLARRRKTA